MYDKRVKVFIAISLAMLLMCVVRLGQMQLVPDSRLQDEITKLKEERGRSRQLQTVRGRILDRNGNVLAADGPRFQICIYYRLSSFLDDRVVETRKVKTAEKDPNPSLVKFYNQVEAKRSQINEVVIPGCVKLGMGEQEIRDRLRAINDYMWSQRAFQAWRRSNPDPNLVEKYGNVLSVRLSDALADFERRIPNAAQRLQRIAAVDDLREMDKPMPLLELKTDDDIFAAQLEFKDINDVKILPTGYRQYPYGSVASQTVGWVGLATQEQDRKLFEDDRLASYLKDDLCGREDGVEYVCESILRGRRGELVYDIDRELVRQNDADYGDDVILTLDVAMQKKIEEDLTNPKINKLHHASPMAAVVIEVGSGDILALVSVPTYDLNNARYNYGDILKDPNKPAIHRAINKAYPPGSSVKPIILIAAMETGKVTAEEAIPCPGRPAPAGWPNCWIFRGNGIGHSDEWTNTARNALKGSCNVYFSHLADRLDPIALQRWLFLFGYGRPLPLACPAPQPAGAAVTSAAAMAAKDQVSPSPVEAQPRQLRQVAGQISAKPVPLGKPIRSFDDIPPMRDIDKRLFGIGQGNLWATPLQVANAFATIARAGLHKPPRLFLQPLRSSNGSNMSADLNISRRTLDVVYDGMSAVVNERGGTAYDQFAPANLSRYGVHVYGKTGSTESPDNAWFAGFVEDTRGRKISVAVVVEGGHHGPSDAAPLARQIIHLCIEAGYIGNGALTTHPQTAQVTTQ
jgi:penicillin-binding protein 2